MIELNNNIKGSSCVATNYEKLFKENSFKKDGSLTENHFLNVPWISFNYNPGRYKLGSKLELNMYVTDYQQLEYTEKGDYKRFIARTEYNGEIHYYTLEPGDHTLYFGKNNTLGFQYCTLQVIDVKTKILSHIQPFPLLVVEKLLEELDDSDTYYMTEEDLTTYDIDNTNNTDENVMVNNITGLNNIIADKANAGYQKIVLYNPNGDTENRSVYRIHPYNNADNGISIPSNIILDLNHSKIKQHVSYGGTSCLINSQTNSINNHIWNGYLEGDFDEHIVDIDRLPDGTTSSSGIEGEGYYCFRFGGAFSTIKNVDVSYVTGYCCCGGVTGSNPSSTILPNNWFKCYIDENGNEVETSGNYLTSGFIESSDLQLKRKFYQCNTFGGYSGISGNSFLIYVHVYDKDKNYIKTLKGRQYGLLPVIPEQKYLRVTLYANSTNDIGTGSGAGFRIDFKDFKSLTQCEWDNLNIHDTRTCGMATGVYNYFKVSNCTLTNCGQNIKGKVTAVAIDIEDGYQHAENYYFFNNKAYAGKLGSTAFILNKCHNFIYENNYNFGLEARPGTKGLVVRNNLSDEANGAMSLIYSKRNHDQSGFSRIYNNNFNTISCGGTLYNTVKDCTYKACDISTILEYKGFWYRIRCTKV